jgi:hypothetical protein
MDYFMSRTSAKSDRLTSGISEAEVIRSCYNPLDSAKQERAIAWLR